MSPAKSFHRCRKVIFPKIFSQIWWEIQREKYMPTFWWISTRILHAQSTSAVSRLAFARCLLLWIAAMLEAACQLLLSRLFCLEIITVVSNLWDKLLSLVIIVWSMVYLRHDISVKSYIMASSIEMDDGYGVSFMFPVSQ